MPTYRGNRGNLLQHWVLVELLASLSQHGANSLCFLDAYSMSPTATRSPKAGTDPTAPEFDRVRTCLAEGSSTYERVWRSLNQSSTGEYPTSAAFVRHCWEKQLHLLLCEADAATADEIASWLAGLDSDTTSFELHRGDWRKRFQSAMPSGFDAYYLSFDPNMYDRHAVRAPKSENMYAADIDIVREALGRLPRRPTVIQLSTYSANGPNKQADVFHDLKPHFSALGFKVTPVRADKAMMSLVFSRDATVMSDLEGRFCSWLAGNKRQFGPA